MHHMLRHNVPDRTVSDQDHNMLRCYMDSDSSMSFSPMPCGSISHFLPEDRDGTEAYRKLYSVGYLLHLASVLPDNNHPEDRLHDDTAQYEVLSDKVLHMSGFPVDLLPPVPVQESSESSLQVE